MDALHDHALTWDAMRDGLASEREWGEALEQAEAEVARLTEERDDALQRAEGDARTMERLATKQCDRADEAEAEVARLTERGNRLEAALHRAIRATRQYVGLPVEERQYAWLMLTLRECEDVARAALASPEQQERDVMLRQETHLAPAPAPQPDAPEPVLCRWCLKPWPCPEAGKPDSVIHAPWVPEESDR